MKPKKKAMAGYATKIVNGFHQLLTFTLHLQNVRNAKIYFEVRRAKLFIYRKLKTKLRLILAKTASDKHRIWPKRADCKPKISCITT